MDCQKEKKSSHLECPAVQGTHPRSNEKIFLEHGDITTTNVRSNRKNSVFKCMKYEYNASMANDNQLSTRSPEIFRPFKQILYCKDYCYSVDKSDIVPVLACSTGNSLPGVWANAELVRVRVNWSSWRKMICDMPNRLWKQQILLSETHGCSTTQQIWYPTWSQFQSTKRREPFLSYQLYESDMCIWVSVN